MNRGCATEVEVGGMKAFEINFSFFHLGKSKFRILIWGLISEPTKG